jgi:hypothetical protein
MKIPTYELKFAFIMSAITTFFVTFVLAAINLGFTNLFILVWMRSWIIAWIMVCLSILYLAPQIRKWLAKP